MKVLVLGSGAREHALVRALTADESVTAVIAAPGNPGIAQTCETRPVDVVDARAVTDLAEELDVDLVVVGPEAPLVAGVSDALHEAGFAVFGPREAAARLEGSKALAKEVMSSAEVPTAMARVATDADQAASALDSFGAPYVVKADGLAAGKGVVVTDDRDTALTHARDCLAVSERVVIEEFLDGPEVSLFVLCDGATAVPLAPAQDFKRIGDDDTGPNTGGMGAYSPLPWAPPGLVSEIVNRVAQPTIDEMVKRGTPFTGVLYCGLALTSRGLRVIEFNVRFGDPETQSVLARLATPLGMLLLAAAEGRLHEAEPLRWKNECAVTVVLAAENYPGAPRTGDPIEDCDRPGDAGDAYLLHAGTALDDDGRLVTSGGRVLSVVGTGADIETARAAAYRRAGRISWPGMQLRSDIARAAAEGAVDVPAANGGQP
ncbi:phosphoribosylamine--glycine ligase [Spelaeicoccus albus]|uniref:Phosphoribosylamine--glycine ligase n=1 Tax=Spelaeicoccus albus TaxID=1280376 RepID=A0A7Z0AAK8_9MICO|nr:phosphoribosylamine--glycine ligase [Spelaeicoccus albus]NYI66133.1 phosphoribosylamine--glycine ligase [Spelaeicoccus albus]